MTAMAARTKQCFRAVTAITAPMISMVLVEGTKNGRNLLRGLVGLPGFEPGISCTPSKNDCFNGSQGDPFRKTHNRDAPPRSIKAAPANQLSESRNFLTPRRFDLLPPAT
jgi:hypothetical protein